jgi:hypothetical protein
VIGFSRRVYKTNAVFLNYSGVGVGVGMLMLLALLGAILYGCIKMKRTRSPKSAQNKQVYDSPQSQTASLQNNSQIDTSQYSETQQTQTYSHEPTTTPQTSQQQYEAPSSGHFMHSSTQTSAAPPVTTFSQGY